MVRTPVSFASLKLFGISGVFVLGAIATLVIGVLGVNALLQSEVRASIKREAEEKAVSWAENFAAAIPSLERIIRSGEVTQEERRRIDASIAVGDVFRFKLFAANGGLKFVSDLQRYNAEGGEAFNAKALKVYQTGQSNVSVHDGSQKPNRPDTYVEAYIAVDAPDGRRLGVIEVYVDVSALELALSHSFSSLSQYLLLGSGLLFLTPAAAMLYRSRQLRLKDQKLHRLARFDHLTGAFNRRTLSAEMSEVFRSRKHAAGHGVLFIDVDHFKQINDTYGHEVGDHLLRHIARLIADAVRAKRDIVGRYGGDEFVVICRDVSLEQFQELGRRIEAATRTPFRCGDVTLQPSLSIGAYLSEAHDTRHSVLRAADLAAYEAKRRGRGRLVAYYEQLDEAFERRRYVKTCLENAIAQDLLRLHFQPIVDARSRKVLGFEGLLRLQDPKGGIISPGEFIPIAEESGLINAIGLWTLQRGVLSATQWSGGYFLSLNLSVRQLQNGDLAQEIANILQATGFPAGRLELEVTETIFISDEAKIWGKIEQIKALGVSVSLDDFGSGYSSLGYLSRYRFDKIKLDRSLINAQTASGERGENLLNAIISLGKALQVNVVAEGVETAAQLEMVTDGGADQIQGFLFSRPMPEEEVPGFIGAHSEQALNSRPSEPPRPALVANG